MSASNVRSLNTRRWEALYRSALSIGNTGSNEMRIKEAEQAILTRARELHNDTGPAAEVERDALEDALYTLGALRNAVVLGTAA